MENGKSKFENRNSENLDQETRNWKIETGKTTTRKQETAN
jgi:hypothetical protein